MPPPFCAVVRYKRSPQTMGDELPSPGTRTFHLTLRVGDQVLAYLPGATSPCPDGPRHRGQNRAPSPATSISRTSSARDASKPEAPARRTMTSPTVRIGQLYGQPATREPAPIQLQRCYGSTEALRGEIAGTGAGTSVMTASLAVVCGDAADNHRRRASAGRARGRDHPNAISCRASGGSPSKGGGPGKATGRRTASGSCFKANASPATPSTRSTRSI